jgi:type I restriction enzyme R subunit
MYNLVASTNEMTVVSEYQPTPGERSGKYQSEAELEQEFINQLVSQGYQYLHIRDENDLIENLRRQLEKLNNITFAENEWRRFFNEFIANPNEGIIEKTEKIQVNPVQPLIRDDGTTKNICLLDKKNVHNNYLQVINQYTEKGSRYKARYDVTILVNGLPLIHIELKRRGVSIREAFNQINRYQSNNFGASSGLFEYIQIFVISNGTHTKYYSNTTRGMHVKEQSSDTQPQIRIKGNSFKFTSYWADRNNKIIPDLIDFTKTFFCKHTILNILTKYCVFTTDKQLLVMRPYQITAAEQILNRIAIAYNNRYYGSKKAGGYIWHTTGSGKTLTSFKTAQLASSLPYIDKVLFVVDRKDLDYQTIKEYDRYEKGAADGNTSTNVLKRQLEDKDKNGALHEYKIIITTIQKLERFIKQNKQHDIYKKHIVLIFDECHRSQFGEMHKAIVSNFKNYYIFGFTGTPIFPQNASTYGNTVPQTTEQVFGGKLHTYTIIDAINDENVLPFKVDFVNTIKEPGVIYDEPVYSIDKEKALSAPQRIREIVKYTLDHFDQKTIRNAKDRKNSRVMWFNSIFATDSIPMAMAYYKEFKEQIAQTDKNLVIATIYSFNPNAGSDDIFLPDEDFDVGNLSGNQREFLNNAIKDYNTVFHTNFDTSANGFQNYYKDVSMRMKNQDIDLLIVVNMFLTGFDAPALNTLWVDKNMRQHGLIQAFSRTNRIYNSVKTAGNIICFRDLKERMDEAIALFGDKDASGIVLLKTYDDYYNGYDENGKHKPGYRELIDMLEEKYPLDRTVTGETIMTEEQKKDFIRLFGDILKIRNILETFDEFPGNEIVTERDFQDYQSVYIDLYQLYRDKTRTEKEDITDEIEFEIELIQQIEVNIDYILALIEKYRSSNCKDKNIVISIDKAINSSLQLRSKKDLIQQFIEQVNVSTEVSDEWPKFVDKYMENELSAIIKENNLKPKETRVLIDNALRDGYLRTTGTAIDSIMPPISRFGDKDRDAIVDQITQQLLNFFEKYFGLASRIQKTNS